MERLITAFLLLSLFSGTSQARAGRAPTAATASASSAASINRATTTRVGPGASGSAVLGWKSCLSAPTSRAARLTANMAKI